MAYVYKLPSGKWRAQVQIAGFPRESATHKTKAQANAWAVDRERSLKLHGTAGNYTLHDVMRRHQETVTPKHRGHRWESIFIDAILRPVDRAGSPKAHLPDIPLSNLSTNDLARWRDARLREVTSATVRREWHVIRAALNVARKEWGWLPTDIVSGFVSPSAGRHRDRVVSIDERDKIVASLGGERIPPVNQSQQVAIMFLVALETGMRRGEIHGLTPKDIKDSVAHLPITKNGEARDVPLSSRAQALLKCMPFTVSPGVADALFRRAVKNAGLEGIRFHDSRHTAATRLASKLHLLELCRMFGWKNPKQAMTYYNATAAEIAKRLD